MKTTKITLALIAVLGLSAITASLAFAHYTIHMYPQNEDQNI